MEGFGCMLFVVAIIAIGIAQAAQRKEKVQKAKEQYQNALTRLQSRPTDAKLKTETLRLGRAYAELAREMHKGDKSVTVFDEVALGNDISAATAGASNMYTSTLQGDQDGAPTSAEREQVETRLEKLASLRERGLITEDEYSQRREKILDEL